MGRNKKKEAPVEVANLFVDVTNHCYDSYYSGEQYGDWHEHYTTTFNGVYLSNKNETHWRDRLPVDFDVKAGDEIYLIYCVYSTGDSFGHSSGGSYDCIVAYKTLEKAEKTRNLLKAVPSKDFDDWTVNIVTENGAILPYFRPWLGYFESLDCLNIQKFTVSSEGK